MNKEWECLWACLYMCVCEGGCPRYKVLHQFYAFAVYKTTTWIWFSFCFPALKYPSFKVAPSALCLKHFLLELSFFFPPQAPHIFASVLSKVAHSVLLTLVVWESVSKIPQQDHAKSVKTGTNLRRWCHCSCLWFSRPYFKAKQSNI